MVSEVKTLSFNSIHADEVLVQTHISSGLPSFNIVGLPDKAISESKERLRAALHSIGLSLPLKKITVNLSPADLLKVGSHYDLPIAMAILMEMEIISHEDLDQTLILGELGLDAKLRQINNVLIASKYSLENNYDLLIPMDNVNEATALGNENVLATQSLMNIINHFKGTHKLQYQKLPSPDQQKSEYNQQIHNVDFADVVGQENAKRALEIAAAGMHNILMIGPPGAGKSMLAQRLPTILPPMTHEEIIETSLIYSLSNKLNGLKTDRPYITPHHTASAPSIIGGSSKALPGQISLAHNGILFLDEFPEFRRDVIEALRQPLETGFTTITRAQNSMTYPANFQLIAAMNPCKCGHLYDKSRTCSTAPICGEKYMKKISGPILDRFDIIIHIEALKPEVLHSYKQHDAETSDKIKERVTNARRLQFRRIRTKTKYTNNHLNNQNLKQFCSLSPQAEQILLSASKRYNLSARVYFKILKVSRTIADLDNKPDIQKNHIMEALTYRLHNIYQG